MPRSELQIDERRENGCAYLKLVGELDMASVPLLQSRLGSLRSEGVDVRLDLSELSFMDSTGLHVLINAMNTREGDDPQFQIEPDVSPTVSRLFELTGVGEILRQQAR